MGDGVRPFLAIVEHGGGLHWDLEFVRVRLVENGLELIVVVQVRFLNFTFLHASIGLAASAWFGLIYTLLISTLMLRK